MLGEMTPTTFLLAALIAILWTAGVTIFVLTLAGIVSTILDRVEEHDNQNQS